MVFEKRYNLVLNFKNAIRRTTRCSCKMLQLYFRSVCSSVVALVRGDSHVVNECNRFALEHTGNVKLLRLTVQEILAKGNQCRGGFEGSNSLTFSLLQRLRSL